MGMGVTMLRFIAGLGDLRRNFINSSIVAEGFISLGLSILFIIGVPYWSINLQDLSNNLIHTILFVGCDVAFLLVNYLDNLFLAFNKVHFLFFRNLSANIIKLLFLLVIIAGTGSLNIVLSVGIGAVITLILSLFFFLPRTVPGYSFHFEFSPLLLQSKMSYALSNQATQLIMSLTPLLYPLIIIRILGPEVNAQFYICWMIANILFIVPVSVSTSAFAKISSDLEQGVGLLWRFLKLTLFGLILVIPVLIICSPWILGLFGEEYRQAYSLLTWFLISSLPYAVNSFAITYYRLRVNLSSLLLISGIPAVLSLVFMVVGGILARLPGLGLGWFVAQLIGALWAVFWFQKKSRHIMNI